MSMFLYNRFSDEMLELDQDRIIGREEGDILFSEDDIVSTKHCHFVVEGDKTFLLDLDSTNGTFVNKVDIGANKKIQLKEGDLIQFGDQELVFTCKQDFDPNIYDNWLQAEQRKRLLASVKLAKIKKVKDLEQQEAQIQGKILKYQNDMQIIKNKFLKLKGMHEEILSKQNSLIQSANNKEKNLAEDANAIDLKKQTLFKKKTNLLDELQMKETVQATEEEKNAVKIELQNIEDQFVLHDRNKALLGPTVLKLRQQAKGLDGKKIKVDAKMVEVKTYFDAKAVKINPELLKLKEKLKILAPQIVKAKEDLEKVIRNKGS